TIPEAAITRYAAVAGNQSSIHRNKPGGVDTAESRTGFRQCESFSGGSGTFWEPERTIKEAGLHHPCAAGPCHMASHIPVQPCSPRPLTDPREAPFPPIPRELHSRDKDRLRTVPLRKLKPHCPAPGPSLP